MLITIFGNTGKRHYTMGVGVRHNFRTAGDENKDNHQLGDSVLMYQKILQTNMKQMYENR